MPYRLFSNYMNVWVSYKTNPSLFNKKIQLNLKEVREKIMIVSELFIILDKNLLKQYVDMESIKEVNHFAFLYKTIQAFGWILENYPKELNQQNPLSNYFGSITKIIDLLFDTCVMPSFFSNNIDKFWSLVLHYLSFLQFPIDPSDAFNPAINLFFLFIKVYQLFFSLWKIGS